MKKAQLLIFVFVIISITLMLASCSSMNSSGELGYPDDGLGGIYDGQEALPDQSRPTGSAAEQQPDKAPILIENAFVNAADRPTSTLSADVDTASYTLLRKLISSGYSLNDIKGLAHNYGLRTEEMVNYFTYSYTAPEENAAFGVSSSLSKTPWNENTYLLTLGVKAREVESAGANNLVFLIDVSGSMRSEDKLPLLQKAFSYLVSNLGENDTVSIVTYASGEAVVLEGCSGNRKEEILLAINSLNANGSTNGEAGINKAYEIAERFYKPDGNNRIILASDGDLNVGISSPKELEALVTQKKNSGIFLSVLGFGTGNFRDSNMSAIAQSGNGVYHYVDSEKEAERIFATSLLSTIYTVAKDVKLQLEFDPQYVAKYRLIGYENRLLNNEDFKDDSKDAGEVGSGHTLTVCYELELTSEALTEGAEESQDAKWLGLAIRYKDPDGEVSRQLDFSVGSAQLLDAPTDELIFIGAVIETSMLLRNSTYSNSETTSLPNIIERLEALTLDSEKAEFLTLIKMLLANS